MRSEHIRVYITDADYGMAVSVYVVDEFQRKHAVQGEYGVDWLDNGPEMEADSVRPLLVLSRRLAELFFGEVVEVMAKRGVKPKDAGEVAGKLEAQTAHLNDLRRMIPALRDA